MYDSHLKTNVIIFFMGENYKGFIILPMQVTCSLIWKWLSYIFHNLENYSSDQDTVSVNQDTNLKRVMCCMPHAWSDLFNQNNIYVTANYAKIVSVEEIYLIWKPSLVTSLPLNYVIHKCPHTSWIPCCLYKGFRVPVDAMYRYHRKCHVYSSNNLQTTRKQVYTSST